ncbi:MAG: lytic transglycosylase domain-containing protein [Rhodospirillaceae bacterium]
MTAKSVTRRAAAAILGAALLLPALGLPARANRSMDDRVRRRVQRLVVRKARRQGVSPALALAVTHVESAFDPDALSHKGARGVMQIMPATARGKYGMHPDRLWDPRLNVRMGLHFLGSLIDRYWGRIDLALSYYNGGSAVGPWPNARVIPWTQGYVTRVRQKEHHYRKALYRGIL